MRKILLAAIAVFTHFCVCAQPPKKIKVLLLGTFHFHHTLDAKTKLHIDIFSKQRQKEINDISQQLARFKPDKIFLEFTEKKQPLYDSIYKDYLLGKEPANPATRANEIVQLGMRTARMLGHKKVFGVNYQPLELKDSAYVPKNSVDSAIRNLYLALDEYGDSARSNKSFYNLPFPYRLPKDDSLLQKVSLTDFFLTTNSFVRQQRDDYSNWNYVYSIGAGSDMSMTDYVGTFWYGTNLRNYNNILRNVDYKNDTCYVIIYGGSHIAFLKHLFEMNPYFEVIDIEKVLK